MQKTPDNWLITRDLKNKAKHTNQKLVPQENAQQVCLTGGFDNFTDSNFTDSRIWDSCMIWCVAVDSTHNNPMWCDVRDLNE